MKSDLEKATQIVAEHGSYLIKGNDMKDHIVVSVAKGIALGRREGLAVAANAIAEAISNLPAEQR